MFAPDQYELIDFGDQRKLERFGRFVLDRPCPAAKRPRLAGHDVWKIGSARFVRRGRSGNWQILGKLPSRWMISHDDISFELRPTDFGHIGVFVEQAANWDWVARTLKKRTTCRVLNLFAYTGGSTLTAAAAGAEVVHVDSSKSVVGWAKRNAKQSGLGEAPIRWIVEDAAKFVEREVRRGSQYDAVILDPPSYGHGPKGEAWKLSRDLPAVLKGCRALLSKHPALLLLTCHTTGFGPAELSAMLADFIFGCCGAGVTARRLFVSTGDGRRLLSGVAARWPG